MLSKSKVYSNPRHCQIILCLVYELVSPLDVGKAFDKWKYKITPGIHLEMSPIHVSTIVLVLSLTTGRVLPPIHVAVDPLFATINANSGNIFPPSYLQAM